MAFSNPLPVSQDKGPATKRRSFTEMTSFSPRGPIIIRLLSREGLISHFLCRDDLFLLLGVRKQTVFDTVVVQKVIYGKAET